ncbi:LCP family protein [Ruminococcus sp. FC2018]|uniref:LCP family protein n=1 Tax=Ruminococcus sp. FC2018 TaxID=1410617 RepID=UPI0006864884|nr:LCP family protein [Ruminococcus sp. FC2018]
MDRDENIFDNTPSNDGIIPDNTANNASSNSGDTDIANRPNPNTNRRPRPNGERRPNPNGHRRPRPQQGDRPVRPEGERVPRTDGQRRPRPSGENRPDGNGQKRQRPVRPDGERVPRPNGQRRPRPQGAAANRPPQRNNVDGKWTKKKKAIIISSIIIAALLLVAGVIIFIVYRYINMMNIVSDDESVELLSSIPVDSEDLASSRAESPEEDKKALEEAVRRNLEAGAKELTSDDNVLNILLIGCDGRSNEELGRSDSMILVSINKNTKKIIMTSFLRDTWVEIPNVGQNRLNAAYAFGGPKLLIQTLEDNFHIRIDKYVRVNFYSFIDAIDALGGVEVNVTEEEVYHVNLNSIEEYKLLGQTVDSSKDIKKAGLQTLDGIHALAYARIRAIGTDFARTERQRTVMEQLFKKAQNMSLSEKNDFLERVLPNITTNLEKGQIFSLILNASDYLTYERIQLSIPNLDSVTNLVINGMYVLGIDFDKYTADLKKTIYG